MTEHELLDEVFQICLRYANDHQEPIEDVLNTVGKALVKFAQYLDYIENG